jgi:hypothetical protein
MVLAREMPQFEPQEETKSPTLKKAFNVMEEEIIQAEKEREFDRQGVPPAPGHMEKPLTKMKAAEAVPLLAPELNEKRTTRPQLRIMENKPPTTTANKLGLSAIEATWFKEGEKLAAPPDANFIELIKQIQTNKNHEAKANFFDELVKLIAKLDFDTAGKMVMKFSEEKPKMGFFGKIFGRTAESDQEIYLRAFTEAKTRGLVKPIESRAAKANLDQGMRQNAGTNKQI